MLSWGLRILVVLVLISAGCQADTGPMFGAPVVCSLDGEAKTVAIGDLNGDGRDDVAIAAWPSALYVFYQQSDGLLGPPVQLYSPRLPLGLAIGDLNQDSRMDLAVGGTDGTILLYYQQTDGTFGMPSTCFGYGLVNSLVIDDLNGDGLADIADTSLDYPIVLVSQQAADGTFGMPAFYPMSGSNARSIRTLDYNSDNARDIALLLDDKLCYLTGSSGGFAAPQYIPATWAYALAAGDVTGDGRDDLVFTVPDSPGYGAVGVIAQGSDGLPMAPRTYPAYAFAQALALSDLNDDGRSDVVALQSGYESATVLCQNADGTLGDYTQCPVPYSNNYQCGALAVGDLNSDGSPDLAIADMWNGLVVLLHAPGASGPLPDTTPPTCTASVSGTEGGNGWYVSAVTVAISAEDEVGGSGLSGISVTYDGATWLPYTESLVISQQGATTVGYRAEDKAGNRSSVQWVSVKLDTAPPVLAVEPSFATIWPPNGAVVDVPVGVTATDAASGVARLHLAVKDEYGLLQPEADVVLGSMASLPVVASRNDGDTNGRVYTIILTGSDAAGNVAEVTSTVTVPRSAPAKPKKVK